MKISKLCLSLAFAASLASAHLVASAQVVETRPTTQTPTPGLIATPQLTSDQLASASSYPTGQCTWGAKVLAPWAGPYWGNGGQWSQSARNAGFEVSAVPKVGAIACWQDGGYGHVAVVTHVEHSQRIQVQESNYNHQQYIANFRGWFDPTAARLGTVSYIYPLT